MKQTGWWISLIAKLEELKQATTEEEIIKAGWINGGSGVNHSQMLHNTTTTFEDTIRDTFRVDNQSRNGTRKVVNSLIMSLWEWSCKS